ncbi:helix-turn-helix domain containing protein [Agrobacterium rhizogenes]|uniref:TetR/AcrR family transcriptional regulator n=1 Tax=Rhizobium rhizogenes TaxID=359 RepID=UPI0022B63310|nr:TetR/AcrR family transcriptional regulator [Rhizobium rhizogenes]MCZ7448834.1 helix-turn-helix domain containing protein [Rhizobium rhizogenes]
MQQNRRTNRQRSDETRSSLIGAARRLLVAQGYAATSTPQVAAEAGVSRGALYHQFEDKQALFRAVIEAEAEAVAEAVDASSPSTGTALDRLIAGARGYMQAMRLSGRCQLLLVDAPAVLGPAQMREIDLLNGGRTLVAGLTEAAPAAEPAKVFAVADLLSAAFDRAALAIEQGAGIEVTEDAIATILLATVENLAVGHRDSLKGATT